MAPLPHPLRPRVSSPEEVKERIDMYPKDYPLTHGIIHRYYQEGLNAIDQGFMRKGNDDNPSLVESIGRILDVVVVDDMFPSDVHAFDNDQDEMIHRMWCFYYIYSLLADDRAILFFRKYSRFTRKVSKKLVEELYTSDRDEVNVYLDMHRDLMGRVFMNYNPFLRGTTAIIK